MRHNRDFNEVLPLIYGISDTKEITAEIGIEAGKINYERNKIIKGWGMMDSFVLAASNIMKAKILTGDAHFRDLGNVILI